MDKHLKVNTGRQCPFVKDPFDECHCYLMNSLNTEAAIYYCGGNFEKCRIYRQYAPSLRSADITERSDQNN